MEEEHQRAERGARSVAVSRQDVRRNRNDIMPGGDLSSRASPEPEMPQSKGKEPELALELEGGQELQKCDSWVKRNTE